MSRRRVARGTSGGFSPLNLTDLYGWWDAAHAASFTYNNGTRVSQWNDRSGNARHLSQPGVNYPDRNVTLNGVAAVNFIAVGNYHVWAPVTSFPRNYTAFVLASVSGSAVNEAQICGFRSSTSGEPISAQIGSGSGANRVNADDRADVGGTTLRRVGQTSWGSNEIKLITVTKNDTALRVYNQGGTAIAAVNDASTLPATTDRFCIGGVVTNLGFSNAWGGAVGEVIMCGSFIGLSQINQCGQYLATKWGMSWTNITA